MRTDHEGKLLCEGTRGTGYRKGNPCNSYGLYWQFGSAYCANHLDKTQPSIVIPKSIRHGQTPTLGDDTEIPMPVED